MFANLLMVLLIIMLPLGSYLYSVPEVAATEIAGYQLGLWYFAILLLLAGLLPLSFIGLKLLHIELIKKGKHPILIRMTHEAIVLAYKSSDAVFDVLNKRLHSLEKRKVAAAIYDIILPDTIKLSFFPISIEWKKYVSKDDFMNFVEKEYDKLVESFNGVRELILEEMQEGVLELDTG